jgi:hypothetical protein
MAVAAINSSRSPANLFLVLTVSLVAVMETAYLIVYRGPIGNDCSRSTTHQVPPFSAPIVSGSISTPTSPAVGPQKTPGPDLGPLRIHAGLDNPLWEFFNHYKHGPCKNSVISCSGWSLIHTSQAIAYTLILRATHKLLSNTLLFWITVVCVRRYPFANHMRRQLK